MIRQLYLCEAFYPSFSADLLIAFLGAVLSLVAAYIVYLLSVWRVRKDRLKYVASLIQKIVPSAIRQAQYCNEHADLITEKPFENNNLKLEANRDPKRLADKVDQEGVYHAYLWKYKRTEKTYKVFQDLYGYIDYLDYLVDDLIKTNERVLMFTWERKKQYQLLFNKTRETMQSLSLVQELYDSQPELIEFTRTLLEEFSENQPEGENLVISHETVVTPLQKFIIKQGKQHPKITELLFLTQDLFNEYNGIELSANHNALDYLDYATAFKTAAENLLKSSERLRKDFKTPN